MMAKIVKGSGAKGIVDYILDKKKQATLIDCQGVLFNDNSTIARSLIAQSRLNPRVDKFIGHISLSFSIYSLLICIITSSVKRGKSCFEKLSEICPINLSTRGLSLD